VTIVNLLARYRGAMRDRRIASIEPGDWVLVSYWHADAQILAAGPVTAVDDDGVWIDVLRVGKGVQFTEVAVGDDMPILSGAVLAPKEVQVGDHVAVIETYGQLTKQTCGYVTKVEDGGFWVGGNWIKNGRQDDNGERRGVTIKRLSVMQVTVVKEGPDLQPMLHRSRYTDEEWEYAKAGRCAEITGSSGALIRCGYPSSPTSYYRACSRHDREIRDEHPDTYGS
jgi:hypothetical protein